MNSTRWVFSGSLVLGVIALASRASADGCEPVVTSTPSHGIDVYGCHTVDWPTVKAGGKDYTYVKATQGNYYQSSEFAGQWNGSGSAGLLHGAFHYFDPHAPSGMSASDWGVTQADYFLAYIDSQVGGLKPGDLPPELDWEEPQVGATWDVSNADIISAALAFLVEVKSKTGVTPSIYTYVSYWQTLGEPSKGARTRWRCTRAATAAAVRSSPRPGTRGRSGNTTTRPASPA